MAPQTRSQTHKIQASSWDRLPLEVRQRIADHLVNIAASEISKASARTFAALPLVSYSFGHDDCYRSLQRLKKGLADDFELLDDHLLVSMMDVEFSKPGSVLRKQRARDAVTWNFLQAWMKKTDQTLTKLDKQADGRREVRRSW